MSAFDKIVVLDKNVSTTTLAADTSTAALAIGTNKTFTIVASGPFHFKLGASTVSAAAATDPYSLGTVFLNTGPNHTSVRIYNPAGGSTITYSLCTYYNT